MTFWIRKDLRSRKAAAPQHDGSDCPRYVQLRQLHELPFDPLVESSGVRGRTVLISDLVTVRLAVGGVAHIGGANDLVRAHLLGASWALLQLNRSLEGLTVLQGLDLGMASNERVGAPLDNRPLDVSLADLVSDFRQTAVGIGDPEDTGRCHGGGVGSAVPTGEFTLVHAIGLVELPRLPEVFDAFRRGRQANRREANGREARLREALDTLLIAQTSAHYAD